MRTQPFSEFGLRHRAVLGRRLPGARFLPLSAVAVTIDPLNPVCAPTPSDD